MLAATLLSIHNLYTLVQLAQGLRQAILEHNLADFIADFWSQRQGKTEE
jgi:tRNA-guanine family transglycosylase